MVNKAGGLQLFLASVQAFFSKNETEQKMCYGNRFNSNLPILIYSFSKIIEQKKY
jgi:hypothetical protein